MADDTVLKKPVVEFYYKTTVVDCDSWRVIWNDIQLSKQPYREGCDVNELLEIYSLAATLTDSFPNF